MSLDHSAAYFHGVAAAILLSSSHAAARDHPADRPGTGNLRQAMTRRSSNGLPHTGLRRIIDGVRNLKDSLLARRSWHAAASRAYWSDSTNPSWKVNSHWRDSSSPDKSQAWDEIGATHLAMYERFSRTCELRTPRCILEWGVGGGANAVRFAPLANRFIAVDVAAESLDETRRRIADVCRTEVETLLVSVDDQARGTAALAGSVDLFICFYVLELVPTRAHADQILRIAHDVLAPGGAAMLQIKYAPTVDRRIWHTYVEDLANNYVVPADSFERRLREVGFDVLQVELVPRNRFDGNYAYFFATKPR